MDKLNVTFEYAGDTHAISVPPNQQIQGAWQQVLAHFSVRPGDARNLGLFHDGNEVSIEQSFDAAGIPDGATLRIRPRVQRNGR